ncbi:MAG: hypothetical protein ABSC46_06420 [Candidatus Limnocylindrales bacterium]
MPAARAAALVWMVILDQVKIAVYHHLDPAGERHLSFFTHIREATHPAGR